jgi:hypothetical protein
MRAALSQKIPESVANEMTVSRQMSRQDIGKNSLALSILWSTGIGVPLTLISQAGTTPAWAVASLLIVAAACLSIAVWMHGWAKRKLLVATVWGCLGVIGWRVWPQPKVPAVEMKISPSGFPISIPAHSTTSILRINPNRILVATGDYLLKLDNTRGAEVTWPSQEEVNSKKSDDYETVFRVQLINHSLNTLVSGKLLFHVSYNNDTLAGCMPPTNSPNYQNDFVLVPELDPGRAFEFYAVNETSKCAWLLPPDKAVIRMIGDEEEKQVPLTFNSDPLYATGVPLFPPTKIAWYALPTKPNSYQISRKEY